MKKLLLLLCLIPIIFFAQNSNKKGIKAKEVLLIENALKSISNSWNEYKLIKYDKIDTLFALPNECKEINEFKFTQYNDSSQYYLDMSEKLNKKLKINKAADYYVKYHTELQRIDKIKSDDMERLNMCLIKYTPKQIGWIMRCRINNNGKEENIEVRFDLNRTKITDIISEYYSLMYSKLLHCSSPEQFYRLKNEWDKRKNIFN